MARIIDFYLNLFKEFLLLYYSKRSCWFMYFFGLISQDKSLHVAPFCFFVMFSADIFFLRSVYFSVFMAESPYW